MGASACVFSDTCMCKCVRVCLSTYASYVCLDI